MKVAFTIPSAVLKAVAIFASTDTSRPELGGVAVELWHSDNVVLVATDGRRLFAIRIGQKWECDDARPKKCVVIPSELIAALPMTQKGETLIYASVDFDFSPPLVTLQENHGVKVSHPALSGKYPDWRTSFEPYNHVDIAPAEGAMVNGELLNGFTRAAVILGNSSPALKLFGKWCDPLFVDMNAWGGWDALGIIMPMRGDRDNLFRVPSWSWAPKVATPE